MGFRECKRAAVEFEECRGCCITSEMEGEIMEAFEAQELMP